MAPWKGVDDQKHQCSFSVQPLERYFLIRSLWIDIFFIRSLVRYYEKMEKSVVVVFHSGYGTYKVSFGGDNMLRITFRNI